MRILKNWQGQMRERFLQKMLFNLDYRRQPVPFDAAHSIGILFDATETKIRDQVLPFIKKIKAQKKKVTPIGYFNNKQDVSAFAFKGYNKSDIDWLGRPKKNVIEEFANRQFDILICIYQGECLPIEYVAALSKAHLRIGPYTDNTYCYDLLIDTTTNNSLKHFLKEVDFYLHKINKKHEPNII